MSTINEIAKAMYADMRSDMTQLLTALNEETANDFIDMNVNNKVFKISLLQFYMMMHVRHKYQDLQAEKMIALLVNNNYDFNKQSQLGTDLNFAILHNFKYFYEKLIMMKEVSIMQLNQDKTNSLYLSIILNNQTLLDLIKERFEQMLKEEDGDILDFNLYSYSPTNDGLEDSFSAYQLIDFNFKTHPCADVLQEIAEMNEESWKANNQKI